MKTWELEILVGVFLALSLLRIEGRSYNRYHSEEGAEKHRLSSTKFGNFQVFWDSSDPYFYVIHSAEPEKILFQTLPSQSFVTVGYATDSNPPIVDGNFKVLQHHAPIPLYCMLRTNYSILLRRMNGYYSRQDIKA